MQSAGLLFSQQRFGMNRDGLEMRLPENRNDLLTVAAVGVLAMCVVTFDHEALGHGSVCVFLHGRILLLSSSLFRCNVQSGWIAAAGPLVNLLMGTLALASLRLVPTRLLIARVFLILITAFSYFWEWGYLIRAMYRRDGDLYYFAEFLLGHVSLWQRLTAMCVGLTLYIFTTRIISDELHMLWPQAHVARTVARTAWISASAGAAVAALAYTGHGWGDLVDAFLEIGGGSFPLLFIPLSDRQIEEIRLSSFIARSSVTVVLSAIIYAIFVVCLGRGITS
jgi:hypothetical protein